MKHNRREFIKATSAIALGMLLLGPTACTTPAPDRKS